MLEEVIAWLPYVLLFIGVWLVLFGVAMKYGVGASKDKERE